jgi:predicted secreted Zn-dependent protease
MRRFTLIFLLFFLSIFSSTAGAEVFQYFDEDGTLIITDNPFGTKKKKPRTHSDISKSPITPEIKAKELKSGLIEDVLYDYYSVSAGNYHEAINSISLIGPYDEKEKKNYAGQTTWNLGLSYKLNYSYQIAESYVNISTSIYDVEFKSYITVLLPSLSENSTLPAQDMKQWNSFLKGLLEHEHDHVRIIRETSFRDEAMQNIASLKEFSFKYAPSYNLDELIKNAVETETAKIGCDMSKKIKKLNDEYDRLTDHGLKPEMKDLFFKKW